MKYAPVLLALVATLVTLDRAASAQTPPDSLRSCARITDPGERLRCYDTQMGTPAAAAPSAPLTGPVTPAAAPSVTAPGAAAHLTAPSPATAIANFGKDDLKENKRPAETASEKELQTTLTSIKEARPDLFIMVMANGQIWMQEEQGTQGRTTRFFKPGYDVRIDKGLFNHYKMWTQQTGEKNWVTVTRLQ